MNTLLMLLPILSPQAHAGPWEGDLQASTLTLDGDHVDYELTRSSWHVLTELGATPILVVWCDGDLLWSQPLTWSSGSVYLPNAIPRSERVEVELVAFSGNWHARSLNGLDRVLVQEPQRPGTGGRHGHQGHSGDAGQRGTHQRPPAVDPTVAVEACDDAYWDASRELDCVAAAAGISFAAELIAACDEAFWDEAIELTCVQAGATAWTDPSAGILACGEAFWDEGTTAQCATLVMNDPARSPAVVASCDEATWSESDALGCIETALAASSTSSRQGHRGRSQRHGR